MANEAYKARARRLVAHLKSKHNVSLSHSAALEAIAAEEGARDWNTLAARNTADDAIRSAVAANATYPVFAWDIAERASNPLLGPLVPLLSTRPSEGKSMLGLHVAMRTLAAARAAEAGVSGDGATEIGRDPEPRPIPAWPRKHGASVVAAHQSIWDFVDLKPRVDHAAFRLGQVVTECIQGRRNDCARGAETGRLSATLLQKEAMSLVRGAEQVFEALEFPASLWRDACGQLGRAVDQATSELDSGWRETARERWAARPADLKL